MTRVLHELLWEAAGECPGKTAVFHKDQTRTYGELKRDAEALAGRFLRLGLPRQARVAVFLEKRFEKVISIFAIGRAGGVFVPIRRLATAPQAAHILGDSGAEILIAGPSRLPLLREHRAEFPALKAVILVNEPGKTVETEGWDGVALVGWDEALEGGAGTASTAFPPVIETDLSAILYTSGSTGKPKGVVLSHLNLVAGAKTVAEFLRIGPDDRLLSILTFGFDYGLNQLTSAFLRKAQIVLLDYLFPKEIIAHCRKYEVTGLAAVAATWIQLLQIPWSQEDMPTLRYITNSGGAIPEPYVRELRKRLTRAEIFLMYGLTEAFRSTFLDPALVDSHPTSIGKAIPGEEVMVLDPEGKPVPPGGTGELVHRGVLVAQGYWNAPELTAIRYKPYPGQPAGVPLRELAVFSGDKVRIDADGLMYFVGRDDEMIKSAGNRISPTEVEDALYASGLVEAAVVLGLPHDVYGQSVLAVVVPKSGADFSPEKLVAHCRGALPGYMVPATVDALETIPTNANGKLDRSLVKREAYARRGLPEKKS